MDDNFDAEIAKAVALIQRKFNCEVGSCNVADFVEDYEQYKRDGNGYPQIDREFERAIDAAARLWGPPTKCGFGPSSGRSDTEGVPEGYVDSRSLRYAWWSTEQASISMRTHDADTLRSFELTMKVRHSRFGG